MTKQQKIRKQVDSIIQQALDKGKTPEQITDLIFAYLYLQGVVIKLDRELPPITPIEYPLVPDAIAAQKAQQDTLRWHNDGLEPLIEEPKQ